MMVPILRKIIYKTDALIERALPSLGTTLVQVGDLVEPFTTVATAKISSAVSVFPKNLKPIFPYKGEPLVFKSGEAIGFIKGSKVRAAYSGSLSKKGDAWEFEEAARDFHLMAGAWGEVTEIIPGNSVLIKSPSKNFSLPLTLGPSVSGEIIVFPNPSEYLIIPFLENFTKDVSGKIFYIGSSLTLSVAQRAHELGINALLAGSIDRDAYVFAKNNNLSVGIFEGFGKIPTSRTTFEELKLIFNRLVYLETDCNILRVPIPPAERPKKVVDDKSAWGEVAKNSVVQILQEPYLGETGVVDSVLEFSIFVRVPKSDSLVEVSVPNFVILK